MKYEELRKKILNWKKFSNCKLIERSPLINRGFPGTFNLSFTEDPWLKEYGKYVDFDHDFIFSTIQSCIRPTDIPLIGTSNSWKYLGVFEIADLNGIINLSNKPDYSQLQENQVFKLVKFLEEIGISREKIHASYNVGGELKKISDGKYYFDFIVPEDVISKNAFLKAGIPKENLIVDKSRDTFLCLHLHQPTPWGYRNEIYVNLESKEKPNLLDIGTIEYLKFKPLFNGSTQYSTNIVGLEESSCGVSLVAFGLERLCLAINGLQRVQDIDYLKPFYEKLEQVIGEKNFLIGESLRALHRIYGDINSYKCFPERHQKQRIKNILSNIFDSITINQIEELLKIHSENQPWHSNLKAGIQPTIERIELYRKSKK